MQEATHRFIRLLRAEGLRIGVSEAVDAMTAAAQPGLLADRELLRSALQVTLVKDRRDLAAFDRVFDRFFRLLRVHPGDDGHGHSHAHDDLSDEGELEKFALSDEPSETPRQGHSHGKPKDLRDFFKPEDLAQQYNLHQEANTLDLAAMTDEIVLSTEASSGLSDAARVQLSTSRLHNPGRPGEIASNPGLRLDVELTVAQEAALFDWLSDSFSSASPTKDDLPALREALSGLLAGLPERLRRHLEALLAMDRAVESPEITASGRERVDETRRAELEEQIRRLLKSMHGAPRARRKVAARGSVDGRRTMRNNMRYDGIPFRPVTVAKVADRPRLLVLADVSLSVRAVARFSLHLVHGLQTLAAQVRTFAFVAEPVEITDLFAEHPLEDALSLVFAGLPKGGVLDVDADSDYGALFDGFLDEYGSVVTRRTTLVILGDGRGNGRDPGLRSFEELTRRARETVWLTPEPRYSWGLGSCDLLKYAPLCDRVQVVQDVRGLEGLVA